VHATCTGATCTSLQLQPTHACTYAHVYQACTQASATGRILAVHWLAKSGNHDGDVLLPYMYVCLSCLPLSALQIWIQILLHMYIRKYIRILYTIHVYLPTSHLIQCQISKSTQDRVRGITWSFPDKIIPQSALRYWAL